MLRFPPFSARSLVTTLVFAAHVACTDDGTSGKGSDSTGGVSGTGPSGGAGGALGGASGSPTGGTSGATPTGGASGVSGSNPGGASGASGTAGAPTGGVSGSGGASGGASGSSGSAGAPGGTAGASGGSAGSAGSAGLYTCPAGGTGNPLPATPMVMRVAGVPSAFGQSSSSNVEGPVWINGALYVSHIQENGMGTPPARILKITGMMEEVFLPDAGTNGLAVNAMGNIVGARHSTGDVATLNLGTKTFAPIAGMYMTARFNSPNDLALRRDGNIYFSDPDFQAPSTRPQNQTRVYRINPQGMVSVVDAGIQNPNGVTLSLDENTLYVATSGNLYRYTVMQDGSTSTSTMMNGVPGSDGMALDCAGNIYLTDGNQRRVVVVSSTGMMLGTISMGLGGNASPTNVAFGGDNHQRLFITTRGSGADGAGLYYIDLNLPGMPY